MQTHDRDLRKQGVISDVFYLVMRRMRFPILLLIAAFAVATAGYTIIPSTDELGNLVDPLNPFEAFYVVVYTATTIGFGEIPIPFNAAQRMWTLFTVLLTVSCWTYSLFAIIGLLQDKAFGETLRAARFSRRVKAIREPFYIVCGVGETGILVMHGLDHLNLRFVVIDKQEEKISRLRLEDFSVDFPALTGDASKPDALVSAGLMSRYCKGVVALAEDDSVNQAIAVTVRLLAPKVAVLARIRNAETETHLGVFGGDLVINPFERFSDNLASAITTPERYRLRTTLTGLTGDPISQIHYPPAGHWIVCSYGRFGREMTDSLRSVGVTVTVVDSQYFEDGGVDVNGTGTKSDDLKKAGIDHALGLVAGSDSDTRNLAIGVTARALRHDLFIVTRQNLRANKPLFDAFATNVVMEPSRIVAQEFLARITTPLLSRFLRFFPQLSEAECHKLTEKLLLLDHGRIPEIWDLVISNRRTPAVFEAMQQDRPFTVRHLLTDPHNREELSDAMVLFVRRGTQNIVLPEFDYEFQPGDRVLLAGSSRAKIDTEVGLINPMELAYIQTGVDRSGGWLWGKLAGLRTKKNDTVKKDTEDEIDIDEDLTTGELGVIRDDE
ncbi:NAD-binding protein [Propionimicrobium lymphophilum]|uniref:RCK N-terminal domain-containing protein n=1 Tax=Propionimicrobium lymphophilum ACS-093-V-SCH5 TaxID=883161 RepID=S2WIF6_9ACTN|nr:potassium channel protein [Propionimicrobium lymphophilum]EPD32407.1 hypothetical protein HMPREF9306_01978 [Propionimicrobium lymphophilum ACS-093-V-SCH5]MDK7710778.1 NAD-binding protein [Propionimicrobium lymphophilum]MDK7734410.1 NAD-binding protein [Propionimicrobium lymphophilum]